MKRKIVCGIFLLLVLFITRTYGQKAEYNSGNNWVHPGGQRFVGMNYVNTATGTLMNNGTIWYSANFTNNGKVGYDKSLGMNPAQSLFAGDALQHISGIGSTHFYNLLFGSQLKPLAYTLEQSITVAHQVDFSKGVLGTFQTTPETMMNMLQIENGATCINASSTSYVDGFVSKTGNTAFTFPIGNNGFYRPVSISAPLTVSDCFAARYLYINPDNAGYSRLSKEVRLASVSDKEYWVVNHTDGTSTGQLTLTWDVNKTSAPVPANLNTLAIARWDGAKWISEVSVITAGDASSGSITAEVTGYGVFTLATLVVNPPVAVNDTLIAYEDTPATINVMNNDSVFDGKTIVLTDFSIDGTKYKPGVMATLPNIGTITATAGGVFTYSPVANYSGLLPIITYTITDSDKNPDKGELYIKVMAMPELTKTSSKPMVNSDGTFTWTYTLALFNDTPDTIINMQVEDNLDGVFKDKGCLYSVTRVLATGSLIANGLYNGSNNILTLMDAQTLAPGQQDSIFIEVKVDTQGQTDLVSVFNQAILNATAKLGRITLKSHVENNEVPEATETDIPVTLIVLPDGFSPNGDGVNDYFVISHSAYTRLDIEVVDRSGNLVYKNSDYQNNWDGKGTGKFLGNDLDDGTYYCSYKLITIATGQVAEKGVKFITLRRNK